MDARLSDLVDNAHAQKIFDLLQHKGFEARFIGGCVRDALLQRPLTDIDIATNATPDQVMETFSPHGIKIIPTGIAHGTVTAVIEKQHFEITTLRRDIETDGRHAQIAFSNDWKVDAERRDFTVNALSLDGSGHIYDYYNGMDDLNNRSLRFIGNAAQRIQEDYLRILRYFRFLSVLGWDYIDAEALQSCTELAAHLAKLSRERIQGELYKLLAGKNSVPVASLLQQHKILHGLKITNLDTEALAGLVTLEKRHAETDPLRRLIALTGSYVEAYLGKLIIITRNDRKRLEALARIQEHQYWKLEKLLYFYGIQAVKDFYFLRKPSLDFSIIQNWKKPQFPLKAAEIMHLGNGPGPLLGKILKEAEIYWVDRNFKPDKEELIACAASVL